DKVEKGVTRHPCLVGKDGDLGQCLDDDAEIGVVANLDDARELSFASISRAPAEYVEIGFGHFEICSGARTDKHQPPCLDDPRIAADRRIKQGTPAFNCDRAYLFGGIHRDRRRINDKLGPGRTRQDALWTSHDLNYVGWPAEHGEDDV